MLANKSILADKSYKFALRIVKLYKYLSVEKKEFVLSKQWLKSETSIGANIKEALQGSSEANFVHKLSISLKEASETEYWLELLKDSEYIDSSHFESIIVDCTELLKLLTHSIKKVKNK